MKFYYVASQQNGATSEGEMEAQGTAEVLEYLGSHGLRPISIRQEGITSGRRRIFKGTIKIVDKIFLAKYLSLMLKIGTDLFRAIDILISDFEKPAVKLFLLEIRGNLEKGQPFYTTFAKYPKYFSAVFVNLIKAGELSGNLEKVFSELSVSLQKEQDLRNEIKAALIYPSLLVVVSLLVVFFLVSFALPRIAKIFLTGDMKPPVFSQIVFGVANFLNANFLPILAFLIIVVVSLIMLFKKSVAFRRFFQRLVRRAPLVGPVLKTIAIQRFSTTFASLLASGLPILDAIEITADAVGDEELKASLIRVSREGIAKGLTVGDAFRRETIFPKTVVNLIAISEKSGHIENILFTLGEFYESEIKFSIKTLVSFLEPVLLLFLGLVVGTIALAVIVPVYQLVGQI